MSPHHSTRQQLILNMPKKTLVDFNSTKTNTEPLLIKGQGVAAVILKQSASLAWEIYNESKTKGLKLEVVNSGCVLYDLRLHYDCGKKHQEWARIASNNHSIAGLDPDQNCIYWFSIDGPNQRVSYGKGEMRPATTLLDYSRMPSEPSSLEWVKEVTHVIFETSATPSAGHIWRDPVTIDPALVVLDTDKITMMDLASNHATVPANLTPACQTIHANVTGASFELNTPDFPDFVEAIEASIRDERGWCHKTLENKKSEFGEPDEKATYLRITMGVNQGDSPGIPNVMEIWPPGHYSPIHNHGDANAIIRVLHGEIEVQLYPMLSTKHTEPFATRKFVKDQVTWLSPGINQIHKLTNPWDCGPTCITIQSYMYGEKNTMHYEYFDFISGDKIEQFVPNSDMGFIEFKKTMAEEWLWLKEKREKA